MWYCGVICFDFSRASFSLLAQGSWALVGELGQLELAFPVGNVGRMFVDVRICVLCLLGMWDVCGCNDRKYERVAGMSLGRKKSVDVKNRVYTSY